MHNDPLFLNLSDNLLALKNSTTSYFVLCIYALATTLRSGGSLLDNPCCML